MKHIDYLKNLVYNEGKQAWHDGVPYYACPYFGVSNVFAECWNTGFFEEDFKHGGEWDRDRYV